MGTDVYLLLALLAFLALGLLWREHVLERAPHWIAALLLLLLAFAARAAVFDYETLDYQNFLTKWVDFFRTHGGFRALRYSVGNYNIPYLYFLALFSLSSIRDLYLIKLLSTFFDVLLAWAAMKLLARFTRRSGVLLGCFFAALCLPTVFLNSAVWAQCDSSYTALALLAIALALEDKPLRSMLCLTLAFGFKLQAVFVMPVFAVLWLYGKLNWKHFLLFPVFYTLLVLPAVLMGRPFLETLTLYFSQTGSIGAGLNYNSSSVFAIFRNVQDAERAARLAILAAFAFMLLILLVCAVCRRRLNDRAVLGAALLFAVGIPFLLPHMHDRYFFCADILTLVLAFAAWPYSPAAALTQFASLLGYHAYLKMRFLLPMRYGAYALIVTLILCAVFFSSSLAEPLRGKAGGAGRGKKGS